VDAQPQVRLLLAERGEAHVGVHVLPELTQKLDRPLGHHREELRTIGLDLSAQPGEHLVEAQPLLDGLLELGVGRDHGFTRRGSMEQKTHQSALREEPGGWEE
jgi:hypothetical protein